MQTTHLPRQGNRISNLNERLWRSKRDYHLARDEYTRLFCRTGQPAPQKTDIAIRCFIRRWIPSHPSAFPSYVRIDLRCSRPGGERIKQYKLAALIQLEHDLHLRKEFVLAVKAIGQGESIMRTLMGDKPIEYILNVTNTLLMELIRTHLTVESFLTGIEKPLSRESLGRYIALQSRLTTLLDEFQNGKLAFQLNKNDLDQGVVHFRKTLDSGIRTRVISILLLG